MKTVELREIDNNNLEECISLRVADEQAQYICSNEGSIKEAEDNKNIARPFAIYVDGQMVGFTMFAFDEEYEDPNDRYWLWRFMIDKDMQGKGFGHLALEEIIKCFKDNGEMNGDEIVLELAL